MSSGALTGITKMCTCDGSTRPCDISGADERVRTELILIRRLVFMFLMFRTLSKLKCLSAILICVLIVVWRLSFL